MTLYKYPLEQSQWRYHSPQQSWPAKNQKKTRHMRNDTFQHVGHNPTCRKSTHGIFQNVGKAHMAYPTCQKVYLLLTSSRDAIFEIRILIERYEAYQMTTLQALTHETHAYVHTLFPVQAYHCVSKFSISLQRD